MLTGTNEVMDYLPAGFRAANTSPEMVELSLILPHWQVEALETAAHAKGLTVAQMLRRVLGGFCNELQNLSGPNAASSTAPA
ncbi:MAG: hypothetical protein ACJ8C4_07820 [Gemmataceae bacterium]